MMWNRSKSPRCTPMVLSLAAPALFAVACFAPTAPAAPTTTGDEAWRVADLLDSLMQPRFLQDMGKFGTTRLPVMVIIAGHRSVGVLVPETEVEKQTLKAVEDAQKSYQVSFLHTVAAPPKTFRAHAVPDLQPLYQSGENGRPRYYSAWGKSESEQNTSLKNAAVKALPRLTRTAKETRFTWQNNLVVLRPVRVSQASCTSCHTQAHQGDILGVMVYAVGTGTMKPTIAQKPATL